MAIKSKAKTKPRKKHLAQRVLHAMEIPPEALGSVCAITLWGNSYARMENHQGVLELRPEVIRLHTSDGVVKFNGDHLTLELLDGNIVQIKGCIKAIEYLT